MNPAGVGMTFERWIAFKAMVFSGRREVYVQRFDRPSWEETFRWWNPHLTVIQPASPLNAVEEMVYHGPDVTPRDPCDHSSAFLRAVEAAKVRYDEALRFTVRTDREFEIIRDGDEIRVIPTAGLPPGIYVFRSFGEDGYEVRDATGRVVYRDEYVTVDWDRLMARGSR